MAEPPNNGQNACLQLVRYSEVPLYTQLMYTLVSYILALLNFSDLVALLYLLGRNISDFHNYYAETCRVHAPVYMSTKSRLGARSEQHAASLLQPKAVSKDGNVHLNCRTPAEEGY